MGIIFNIIDSVWGSKDNQSSNNAFDEQRWDALIDKINNSINEGNYSRAESQLGNYYSQYEPEKDYYYYWYRTEILVCWLESCPSMDENQIQKLYNRASDSIRQALKLAPDEDNKEHVEEMKERYEVSYNSWKSMKSYMKEWNEFVDRFDQLCDDSDFPQAEALLEKFYFNSQEDYDIPYFDRKIYCVCSQYKEKSFDDQDEPSIREQLTRLLLDFQSLCDDDEENKETFNAINSMVQCEMAYKDIDRMSSSDRYDEALNVVEKFKYNCPDDIFNYFGMRRLVLQRKWRATSVTDTNYSRIEQDVLDAYKAWEDNCTSDNEKEGCSLCYNEAFVTIKKEKEEEKRMLLSMNLNSQSQFHDAESQYLKEVKLILEDGEIGTSERKLLERKRTKLGLSKDQAKRIEDSLLVVLTSEEQEYADIYNDLMEEGEPTGKLRKLLDREADALGLTPEQVEKVEQMIKSL